MKRGSQYFLWLVVSAMAVPRPGNAASPASAASIEPVTKKPTVNRSASNADIQKPPVSEEVIVTARKRRESLLKTPVVEAVIGQRQLERFGTMSVKAAVAQVPDVVIGQALGAFGAQISMRGVGTSTLNPAVDQSVSLNIDGMQVTQGIAYQSGMFDLGRIEVLKGPQALFYGKSSTAGVITLQSNDPTNEFEVIARSMYDFEAAERRGELIVSGPVTDTLGLRLATSIGAQDGFFRNEAVGVPSEGGLTPRFGNFAPSNDMMVRGTALWKPWADFDSRLKINYVHSETNGDGGGGEVTSCPGGTANTTGFLPGVAFLTGPCGVGRDNVRLVDSNPADFPGIRNGGTPFNRYDEFYGTFENNYRPLPLLTLTSVTGYYALHDSFLINGTESQSAGPTLDPDDNFYRRDASEELRLTSDFNSPVNFATGAYIQDGKMFSNVHLLGNEAFGLPATIPGQWGTHAINIDSQSLFGQVIWKVIPKVELSAGARWTHEDRTDDVTDNSDGARIPLADPRIDSYHINPEVSLTYTPTNTLTLYGSFKTASKSGSFSADEIPAAGTSISFGDETVKGGEVGVKGLLFNRRLRFNIDAYRYNYDNLQVGVDVVSPQGVSNNLTLNAASALVQGIEMNATYQVPNVQDLVLHGSAGLNEARFGNFPGAPCAGGQTIAQGCNQAFDAKTGLYTSQNLAGRPLVRAPNFTANFGLDYGIPVMNNWNLEASSDTNFSSSYYTDLILRSDTIQGSFFKTNLALTMLSPNRRWELAFIGNNLANVLTTGNCVNAPFRNGVVFNSSQITGGTTSGRGGPDDLDCLIDRGRELWLRMTWHFTG